MTCFLSRSRREEESRKKMLEVNKLGAYEKLGEIVSNRRDLLRWKWN